MTLKETLLTSPSLELRGNVFYQKEIAAPSSFEQVYSGIRDKEGRLYSDHQIKLLPRFKGKSDLESEWKKRNHASKKLIRHLVKKNQNKLILELGCGNGWLSNLISESLPAQVVALDRNEIELMQGARVFGENKNLAFIYGDVFTINIRHRLFDSVIIASAIQYFPNLKLLVNHLTKLVKPGGEIHILDSPIYNSEAKAFEARNRSSKYFEKFESGNMTNHYFHHHKDSLSGFRFDFLFNPNDLGAKVVGKIVANRSPFPWIVISNT